MKKGAKTGRATGEKREERKINPYDGTEVKTSLDDAVVNYFCEVEKRPQNHTFSNNRLVLGYTCCTVALISHFYPIPWPEIKPLLVVCIVIYAISSLLWYIQEYIFEKKAVLVTKETRLHPSLRVVTTLPKYSDQYTVTIAFNQDQNKKVTKTFSIGEFITESGLLDEESFNTAMQVLSNSLLGKKNM